MTRAKQRDLSFEISREISLGGSVFDRDFEKSKFLEGSIFEVRFSKTWLMAMNGTISFVQDLRSEPVTC